MATLADEADYGFLVDAPDEYSYQFLMYVDDAILGKFHVRKDVDSYYTYLPMGQTYTITAHGVDGAPPPYFEVEGFVFPLVTSRFVGNSSVATFVVNDNNGILVSFSGDIGDLYTATMVLHDSGETAGVGETIRLGQKYFGLIDYVGESDHFSLNVKAGHTYNLKIDSTDANLVTNVSMLNNPMDAKVPIKILSDHGGYIFTPTVSGVVDISFHHAFAEIISSYGLAVTDLTAATGNHAPLPEVMVQNLVVLAGEARSVVVGASDTDGDRISYSASDAWWGGGTVAKAGEGEFVYRPDRSFTGWDRFEITLSDPKGGAVIQEVNLLVLPRLGNENWRLVAGHAFSVQIGGSGTVFGTSGHDDVTVMADYGTVVFDPSFNDGGDIIRLAGSLTDWSIAQRGSAVVMTNGFTSAIVPVGPAGTTLVFGAVASALRYDIEDRSIMLGNQAVTEMLSAITVSAIDGLAPPVLGSSDEGRLLLNHTAAVSVSGDVDVFGGKLNTVHISGGEVRLDPSFNDGNDTIILEDLASEFTVKLEGSSVVFTSDTMQVTVPVSPAETSIVTDTLSGNLLIDTASQKVFLGEQEITGFASELTFA